MLRFEHVSLSYGSQQILDDLSFEIQEGQMALLIGPSGCGKTTTLKMINRLIEPTAGRIYLDGQDITTKDKVELRRHIGYVIQQIGLFPNMTVAQNISVVPTLLKYSREECDRIVRELLDMVNLPYEQENVENWKGAGRGILKNQVKYINYYSKIKKNSQINKL